MKRMLMMAAALVLGAATAQAEGPRWTGLYVGIHGAYVSVDQEFPGAAPHVPSPVPAGVSSGPPRMDLDGGMLGGQIGYMHQMGPLVIGVEADYARGALKDSARDGNYIVQNGEIEWTGSLRVRLGLPAGNFMPYVTGGLMWAGASYSQSCPERAAVVAGHCSRAGQYDETRSQNHAGWVVGAGLEHAVSRHFSIRAEALWFDLGDKDYAFGPAPLNAAEPIGTKKIEYDGVMIRIGANYRF